MVLRWEPQLRLHHCLLLTQFLALGLISYTQAHRGSYSPLPLEDPLMKMTLDGTMVGGFNIKACLRELTCLGGMVGGPVFVFMLLNAHLLNNWQTNLNYPLHSTFVDVEVILQIPELRPAHIETGNCIWGISLYKRKWWGCDQVCRVPKHREGLD